MTRNSAHWVMCARAGSATIRNDMTTELVLDTLSNQMADVVAAAATSVVQVHGRRRPASGRGRAGCGGDDRARAGWRGRPARPPARWPRVRRGAGRLGSDDEPRRAARRRPRDRRDRPLATTPPAFGHLALAVARSWSNALTASAGIVSVIGGPLPTGRRRAIDEVIRTTAPMHDGFAGGALHRHHRRPHRRGNRRAIRGLGVVIPASIAWKTVATLLEHGQIKRGYLGLAGQRVRLADGQAGLEGRNEALLVVAVTPGSPAAGAGVLVGDLIVEFNAPPSRRPRNCSTRSPAIWSVVAVPVRVLRGGAPHELTATIGERPAQ